MAKDVAEGSGAKLNVAHAGQMVGTDEAGIFVDSTEGSAGCSRANGRRPEARRARRRLALVKASHSNAAQMMADFARDAGADVLVVGNRGYGPVAAVFLGSFTFRLLQVAPCPVLVVPTGQPLAT